MTMTRITLESFDEGEVGPSLLQNPDYQKGLEDGLAQAETTHTAQHAQALSDISTTLGDMAFGYAEARGELLDQIRPILAQIAEAILPALARESFAAHVVETVDRAFVQVTEQAVEIAVAPDLIDTLSGIDPTFKTVPDPMLTPGQARLRQGDTHLLIDLPSLVTALQSALQGLEATQRTPTYG